MSIRQMRLDRGWTQSQLAQFSGLSLRTIQRIEKGRRPTAESLKALASVFETDVSALTESPTVDEAALSPAEAEALDHIRRMRSFFLELFAFLLAMPLLILSNWLFHPEQMWSGLTALGWGTWLAIQAFDIFETSDLLGPRWEKRQLEKRIRKDPQ